MKRLLLLPLLALAVVAPAQGQNTNNDITIKASANPVVFKTPTTFDGRVKGVKEGVDVVLQRRSSTTTTEYTTITTVKTTGNGEYTFTVTPRRNGLFRAMSGTAVSEEIALGVAPKVTLSVGPNRFKGRVRPAHDGRKVQLQRQNADGTWTTVKKARLRDTGKAYSRFRKRTPLQAGASYRAILPAHTDHVQGESLAVSFSD